MADLDDAKVYGASRGKVAKQADGNPVTMLSVDLGATGKAFAAYVQVGSRDDDASGADDIVMEYNALLFVSAWYNATAAAWVINSDVVHSYGTMTVTWAAAMNGNAVEITADSAAGHLHWLAVPSALRTEFAMTWSVA